MSLKLLSIELGEKEDWNSKSFRPQSWGSNTLMHMQCVAFRSCWVYIV